MHHRAGKLDAVRITLLGKLGQLGATWIAQTKQLGSFVKGLASRIIKRFTQQLIAAHVVDTHELGMATRHQQGNKRKSRLGICQEG